MSLYQRSSSGTDISTTPPINHTKVEVKERPSKKGATPVKSNAFYLSNKIIITNILTC